MSFVPMGEDFTQAKEEERAPAGSYKVTCFGVEEKTRDSGQKYAALSFSFDEADHPPFTHFLSFPTEHPLPEQDEAKHRKMNRFLGLMWRRAVEQFQVPYDDGVDPADFKGVSGEAEVIIGNGGFNEIRFDRLPEEGEEKGGDDTKASGRRGGGKDNAQPPARSRRRAA